MRLPFNTKRTPFATTMLVAIALVSAAVAYFTTTGSGNATGSIATMSAPASPAASASGTTATITWNASTIGGSVAASSYTVERYTSTGTDLGAASCSPVASSSGTPNAFGSFTCSDSPGGGSFEYKITGKYHSSWTATTAFTNTVSVQYTTSTSASGPATDATSTAIATGSISSTLAGAGAGATGTITFKVFGPQASAPSTCTSGGTTVGTATVSGNATYHPSAGFTPVSVGTYWWYASYGGDSANASSASTCGPGMSSTVVKNTTTTSSAAPASGNVGTAISTGSISSTLAGATAGATGTITFTVFGPQTTAPSTCTSGGTTVGTATVSGNSTYHPSASFTPSSPGTYWWYASYGGDSSNSASSSTCGTGMTSTSVAKANTALVAGAPATNSTGFTIATSSISAALSGGTSGSGGTVTFTVFGPQASAPSTCTTGGTTVGTATVSGNGTYNPSAGYTPSAAGTYWWYVSYNGDSNNAASNSACGSGMTSTVVKNLTITTASGPATDVSGTAIAAGSIGATLSGGTAAATGTITFKVFGPQSNAPTDCSGGTTVGTATVSGNATYHPSAGFTPFSAGTYYWYVSYNGDTSNGSSTSTCGPAMASTYVYSVSSAASGSSTTASSTSVATSSFTVQPSTTYLLLVARSSSAGDAISSVSSTGLSPSLTLSSFTAITSQNFTGNNYQWAYYITTSAGASGTGTLTVNFSNTLPSGAVSIVDLLQVGGVSATNPVVSGNAALTSGTGSSGSTANLTYAPSTNDSSLVFLSGDNKMGAAAPAATPSMTNAYYLQNGAGSAAVYSVTPGSQNESFGNFSASQNWGSMALELRRDAPVTTPTLTAGAPSTATAGAGISSSAINASLSGAPSATNGITFKVFGPQASAPTTCTSGGTAVGTGVTVSGNGSYHPSAGFTPVQAGTYWWYADYSGDQNDIHTTSTCGAGMASTVVSSASPTIMVSAPATGTTAGISAGSITGTLSGGSAPTGTITYTVFGPQASAPTNCTTGGTTVGTSTVTANGTYTSSAGFTPAQAGTYWWYASYGGDSSNNSAASTCGSAMGETYVYSVSSAASATATTASSTSITSSSFTVQPSSTYLLLVFRNSSAGDGISSISSSGLSPSLTQASFSSITSQAFTGNNYEWAYYITTSATASGTGTLTVNFANALPSGGIGIVDVLALAGSSATNPVVLSNQSFTNGTGNSGATANLPSAPGSVDSSLVFLAGDNKLQTAAPVATPAMTSAFFFQSGSGSAAVYSATPGNQNESFANFSSSQDWGAMAFEIRRTGSANTTSMTASAPSTDTAGTAISSSSLSGTLSGAASGATGTVSYYVVGPQASAPTSCTGGTKVGTATVSGNGTYTSSAGYTPTQGGTYWWYTIYGGDPNNFDSASPCGSGMASTVVSNATTSLTVAAPASGGSGFALSASAITSTLSGGTSGATGTITYTVFGPQASAPTNCTTGGTTVGTSSVSGNGAYSSSAGFTPSAVGTYWWYASYGGDSGNSASNSGCGAAMPATYIYSASSVASANSTTGSSATTGSFTLQPNTTYLLLVFRHSTAGDGVTSIFSTGLSPALTTSSFTSIASQNYNTAEYQWAYWITTSSSASGSGTITVNFNNALGAGQVTDMDLVAVGGVSPTAPVITTNEGLATGGTVAGTTYTANLPNAPSASDVNLVFLSAIKGLGSTAPAATPAMSNLFYVQGPPGALGVYAGAPAVQNESLSSSTSAQWGTMALELTHP